MHGNLPLVDGLLLRHRAGHHLVRGHPVWSGAPTAWTDYTFRCGAGTEFALFTSAGASPGNFTQMGWQVDDGEGVVAELRQRGVVFEEVDMPGFRTESGIAEIEGNYPSKGARGERAAWFRDSEGNLLGVGEPVV
ncbi:VOC family protein [Streptomyces europaeiscabiei]|uniref:VOC family protein n=1 Tax=Streptomyces europaeiscabiei TaxID=146819 RepID=UPI002E2E2017|nr:VOC family protein [Streptomyces europaeiscabiei]